MDKNAKLDAGIIPGSVTSHLQPADVSWNKSLKSTSKDLWNKWMVIGELSFMKTGNIKSPDKLTWLNWMKVAWSSVATETIMKCFKVCEISVETDDSEDSMIHCLKLGEVGAEAAAEVARLISTLEIPDNSDPFTNLDTDIWEEDKDELQTNSNLSSIKNKYM